MKLAEEWTKDALERKICKKEGPPAPQPPLALPKKIPEGQIKFYKTKNFQTILGTNPWVSDPPPPRPPLLLF